MVKRWDAWIEISASRFSYRDGMEKKMEKVILGYVSQYQEKYYWNEDAGVLPDAVKKEILMNMIFITEEAGGVCELGINEDGDVYIDSYCEEGDLGYDQVSGRLLVSEMERTKRELLSQLQTWYRTTHPEAEE